MLRVIQVRALVARTLDADQLNTGYIETTTDPAGQVLVGRDRQMLAHALIDH